MDNTTCLVMDNVWDRDKQKLRVKVVRTSNHGLYAGSSTVAVFRIRDNRFKKGDKVKIKYGIMDINKATDGSGYSYEEVLPSIIGTTAEVAAWYIRDTTVEYIVSTIEGQIKLPQDHLERII